MKETFLGLLRLVFAILFIVGIIICFFSLWKGILLIVIAVIGWNLCGKGLETGWKNTYDKSSSNEDEAFTQIKNSEVYEKGVTADGNYDFTMMTKSEDEAVMDVLYIVNKKYKKENYSLGFIEESAAVIYKPGYILNEIIVQLYNNSTDPFEQLATGLAYNRKGAYFRNEAIKFLQLYMDNYKPCPIDSYLLSEQCIVTMLADLYKKEYDYQKAYECLTKYIDKGNIPEIREMDLLGDLLKKIDINKCVDYFERLLHSPFYNEETMHFINNSLVEALKLQEKGYKYRPRKNHVKPFNEQMELDIREQAAGYVDLFKSM